MRNKINSNSTQMKQIELINTDLSAKIRPIRIICVLFIILFLVGCGKNYTPEQKAYIARIGKEREAKNEWMKNDDSSPFNKKGKIEFHNLNYFDVDPDFVFKSKLFQYSPKGTVTVFGTKGDERKMVRYGYFMINYDKKDYKVNFYEGTTRGGDKYYTISFTDQTTNDETYGVGRYIEMELNSDPDHLYDIDFNLAFSPYCAYSPDYSCSIPLKEDYIPIAIRAGEKKYHD
ncbi:hypothetical protein C0389_08840 [bacterium]|nr:hypothetical protein [bacterium]